MEIKEGVRAICNSCKENKDAEDFQPTKIPLTICRACFLKKRREYRRLYAKAYYHKPERKERQRMYDQRPEVKERRRISSLKYWNSEEGRAKRRAYKQSPEGKAAAKSYRQSPQARQYRREYFKRQSVIQKTKEYRIKPETITKSKEYRSRPDVMKRQRDIKRRNMERLDHTYVKMIIRNKSKGVLKAGDIPEELIELFKKSIMLKRTIKQKNKKNEQPDSTDI